MVPIFEIIFFRRRNVNSLQQNVDIVTFALLSKCFGDTITPRTALHHKLAALAYWWLLWTVR